MGIPLHPGQEVANLKSDLGGSIESNYVDVVSVGSGSFETFTVTFPAGDGAAQADYFSFVEPGGATFACWLDLDANGTTPTGAIYTAATNKIEVDVVVAGTPDTAAAVAAAVKTAIEADIDFVEYDITDNLDGTLTFVANILGNATDAAPHNTGDTGAGSIAVSVTSGSAASSQNTYFVLRDDDTGLFHVWLNVNSEGVDPDPGGGSVAIETPLVTADSTSAAATAIATAVNAHAEFEAEADGSRVKITAATKAAIVDIGAGDSGFTVSVSTQGSAEKYSSSGSPSDISNNPSTF